MFLVSSDYQLYTITVKRDFTANSTEGRLLYAGKGSRTLELLRETLLRRSPLTTWLSPQELDQKR